MIGQLSFEPFEIPKGYKGQIIRSENPYVKLLQEPKWNSVNMRYEVLAQVENWLCFIEVKVTPQ